MELIKYDAMVNATGNHANLPTINDAQLPETYERAKTALSECSSLDECKDWSDKAQALASYARQSKDDSLRKMAERIQARAIRRAGEILKQIEPATGAHLKSDGADTLSRKQAADDAGLSERQRNNALRVASIDTEEFAAMVESDNPPTVTKLAEIGTKKQLVDLNGRDPQHFNTAMHFIAKFKHHLNDCKGYDIPETVEVLTDDERKRLRLLIDEIDAIHDQIMTRI